MGQVEERLAARMGQTKASQRPSHVSARVGTRETVQLGRLAQTILEVHESQEVSTYGSLP